MEIIWLNGVWSFCTDPANQGKENAWSQGVEAFSDTIEVPGGWPLEDRYRDYHGIGWYRRSFILTQQMLQKNITLCFGGVYRRADVYINGCFVTQHIGYQTAFEADIRPYIKMGENTITVAVDDTCKDCDCPGGLWGEPQMCFGGIYEPVWLEMREPVRTADVFAVLTPDRQRICVQLYTENTTDAIQKVQIILQLRQFVRDGEGTLVKEVILMQDLQQGSDRIPLTLSADGIALWSPDEPNLYVIAVRMVYEAGEDIYTQRTGFKYFTVQGKDFYLNGKPFFLRGYGDDFVFPMTGHPSAVDKTYYYHSIMRAKEYGFNGVRHHSHFPFKAYFEAADELGLLVQPELGIANVPVHWFNQQIADFCVSQWADLIKEHRHHPSVMAWCGGNEQEWGYFFEDRISQTARQLDGTRPVVPTDGRWMAREIADDGNYDYISVCYVEYADVLPLDEYADLYTRDDCGKPQIVHEMGNFTTVFPVHDLAKYEGARNYPHKWKKWEEAVQSAGRMELYERAKENALAMQKLCFKLVMEKARHSDAVRGYHLWTLTDFYDTTQGLLNQFYEDKAYTAQEFSELNRASLLLWDTERWCFTSGEKTVFKLELSHFEPENWPEACLQLVLMDENRHILQQMSMTINVMGHGTKPLADWELTLPQTELAQRLCLAATLSCGGQETKNTWDLWVYPKRPPLPAPSGREVFIHYLARHLVEDNYRMVRHYTIPMPLKGSLLVTGYLMEGMLAEVAKGTKMLLLAQPDTFTATVTNNAFKPCWWTQDAYFYINRSNNTQITNVIEEHPALKNIPHKNNWELNWFHLVEQRHAVDLEKLPFPVTPIIYGLGQQLEKRGYLFEFSYGEGAVLVCTLNFEKTNLKHPEVQYVFDCLLDYCDSEDFFPTKQVTPEKMEAALRQK